MSLFGIYIALKYNVFFSYNNNIKIIQKKKQRIKFYFIKLSSCIFLNYFETFFLIPCDLRKNAMHVK